MTGTSLRWFYLALLLLIVTVIGILLVSVGGLVRLLVVCALLAYVLDPVASYFQSLGLSRTQATVVVFLSLGALLATISLLLYPVLSDEVEAMQSGKYTKQTNDLIDRMQTVIHGRFGFLGWEKVNLAEKLQAAENALGNRISSFLFSDLVSSVAHLVAIPFIIFFFLKDGREMKKRLISLVPNRYFEFALHLLYRMDLSLGNFLRGQFLDGLVFGLLTTLALWLLNVNYFLFIGCFAGLANLIPYVGPIAGAALSVLVVMMTSNNPSRVVYVLLAFACIKLADDALIQPLTVAKSVEMHPLLVLLVIIIGGHFFGILGMLLAVPVTGFAKVGFEEGAKLVRKYRHSRLMEPEVGAG